MGGTSDAEQTYCQGPLERSTPNWRRVWEKKKKKNQPKQLEGIEGEAPRAYLCEGRRQNTCLLLSFPLSLSFFSILPELSYSAMCLQGE